MDRHCSLGRGVGLRPALALPLLIASGHGEVELAHAGLGDLVDEDHLVGQPPLRELSGEVGDHLLEGRRRAGPSAPRSSRLARQ